MWTRALLSLAILGFTLVLALSLQSPAPPVTADGLVAGDIAWMLTATGMVLYHLVDFVTPLRVDEDHEQLGLDLSQHGERIGLFDWESDPAA